MEERESKMGTKLSTSFSFLGLLFVYWRLSPNVMLIFLVGHFSETERRPHFMAEWEGRDHRIREFCGKKVFSFNDSSFENPSELK